MQSTSGEDAATKVAAFFVVVLSLAKACFRRDRDTTKMMAGLAPPSSPTLRFAVTTPGKRHGGSRG